MEKGTFYHDSSQMNENIVINIAYLWSGSQSAHFSISGLLAEILQVGLRWSFIDAFLLPTLVRFCVSFLFPFTKVFSPYLEAETLS